MSHTELDRPIEEITVDAYGEDEQLGSFACVLDELLDPPVVATVVGSRSSLLSVEDGGPHPGLRATYRRERTTGTVALVDVVVDEGAEAQLAGGLMAYRRWLGPV